MTTTDSLIEHHRDKSQPIVAAVVLCAFFASGACGLIHEIAWTRLLRLVMGNTTFTITAVLCAFMSGLALGSYIGGRIIDRRADPLKVLGILEITIGVFCFFLPELIDAVEPVYRWIYQQPGISHYALSLIRFAISVLLLIVPATCMGATLPVLTRFVVRSTSRIGWSVGALYATNTFGAVLGVCVTGFFLIPALGVRQTINLACVINISIGLIALLLHYKTQTQNAAVEQPPEPIIGTDRITLLAGTNYLPAAWPALLIGYGFSGFAALTYEISWTRALLMLVGSSVYSFSLMLMAFVLGLALGSMAFARFSDRVRDPMRALAIIEISIGLSALLVIPIIGSLPIFVTGLISRISGSFGLFSAAMFALVVLVMLVPTTLMGAAFPLATRIATRTTASVGRSVGSVYASNTTGSILGTLTAGFILIPFVGVQTTMIVAVAVNVLVGCLFLGFSSSMFPARRLRAAGMALALTALIAVMIPPWDKSMISFGPFLQAQRLSPESARADEALIDRAQEGELLFYKDGVATTVTVRDFPDQAIVLYINGKPDASTGGDMPTQLLLAHIPMLMHAAPKRTLVIGLASGITLGAVGRYPADSLKCVEISPAVLEASRYFNDHNYNIIEDPRAEILIADGRNHVALTADWYDVIISEPSNPWIAGVADLFTREFFQACSDRLEPGGITCTWLATYNMELESFRSVVATFQSVFPHTTIWQAAATDYLMIGSDEPLTINYKTLADRLNMPTVTEDLKRIGIDSPPALLAHFVMGKQGVAAFSEGAPIHTDDNALLEYQIPRQMIRGTGQWPLINTIERHREFDLSFLTHKDDTDSEIEKAKKRTKSMSEAKAHVLKGIYQMDQGDWFDGVTKLGMAAAVNPDDWDLGFQFELSVNVVYRLLHKREFDQATTGFRALTRVRPKNAIARYGLASALQHQGQLDAAIGHYRIALRYDPEFTEAHTDLGQALESKGQYEQAMDRFRHALKLNPDMAPAHQGIGRVHAARGELDEAIVAFRHAYRLAPNQPDNHRILVAALQLKRQRLESDIR